MSRAVRVGGLLMVAAIFVAVGGCAPNTAAPRSRGPVGRANSARLTGPSIAELRRSSRVVVQGRAVAVPTEEGTTPIAPQIDEGQHIIITARGMLPARLYSQSKEAVTWTNLTDEPQRVIFDYLPVRSPLIPPGGSFSWTSASSQSIAYHSASGLRGVDTVLPPFS